MKTANSENNNVLDFQDPGMMGDELLNVPGFVNELTNHTLAVSNRPNKPLAFAGALAMITHLAGRPSRRSSSRSKCATCSTKNR